MPHNVFDAAFVARKAVKTEAGCLLWCGGTGKGVFIIGYWTAAA